jgi:hypothetical protein
MPCIPAEAGKIKLASGPCCGGELPCGYVVTQIEDAVLVPGDTDIGNHGDEELTTIPLPFPYTLYDQTFTEVTLSSNCFAQFSTTGLQEFSNSCLPKSGWPYIIFPAWTDLVTDTPGAGIFTSISGTAPHRVFNIEWRANYFGTSDLVNCELRLYEGQTRFDIIYGEMARRLLLSLRQEASQPFSVIPQPYLQERDKVMG